MAENPLKNSYNRIQISLHIVTLLATNPWIFYVDRNPSSGYRIPTFLSCSCFIAPPFYLRFPVIFRLGIPFIPFSFLLCLMAHYPLLNSSCTIQCYASGLCTYLIPPLIVIYQANQQSFYHISTY